jgi:Co/Zn/Cd efflux system component
MVIKVAGRWISGGLMLTSDAAHMLSHFTAPSINLMTIKLAHKIPANIIAQLVSSP